MIDLKAIENIYLYSSFIDFRYGINGLSALVSSSFQNVGLKGSLFVFCNKRKTQLKILQFDTTGVWLYQKKLNKGKFIYPNTDTIEKYNITKEDLKVILEGLEFIQRIEGNIIENPTYY